MLRVYWADIDGADLGVYMDMLSRYRLGRLAAVRGEAARRQGIAAEALLIRALGQLPPGAEPPLDIIAGENGKPFLQGSPLSFSLSHSGNLALCAVSSGPVGADIQVLRRCNERLVSRFFTPDEREHIFSSADRDGAFTEIWALKESYVKALGAGLSMPLDSFSALPGGRRGKDGWRLRSYPVQGGYAAICASNGEEPEFFVKTEL